MEALIKMTEFELRYCLRVIDSGIRYNIMKIIKKYDICDLSPNCKTSKMIDEVRKNIINILIYRNRRSYNHPTYDTEKRQSLLQRTTFVLAEQVAQSNVSLNNIPHFIIEIVLSHLKDKSIFNQLVEKKLSLEYYHNDRILKIASRISFGILVEQIYKFDFLSLNIVHGLYILNNESFVPLNIFEFGELIYYYKIINQLIISDDYKRIIKDARDFTYFGYKPLYFDLIEKHGIVDETFEYNPGNLLRIFILLIKDGIIISDRLKKLLLK